MKSIFRIARVELSTLFYSPIAWLLLILFFVQATMAYVDKLDFYASANEAGRALNNLTFEFFASPMGGIFTTTVLHNLYLYIPLITMGLISREVSGGTIKLLYSSPVKLLNIVLGKYLAMVFFNLCMVFTLFLIVFIASFHIDALDWNLVFSGLFGIFLLLSAYAAIGLFMSSLTSYQVVAAIATFAVFAFLSFIGTLWQEYDLLRDLTSYLSISGRTETIVMGLINTRDVIYYVLITALFITFAWFRLKSERTKAPIAVVAGKYIMAIATVLVIGYITSQSGFIGYWDTTRSQMNTLSTDAQEVLRELGDEPLEVTSYVNLIDQTYGYGRPGARNEDRKRWERYLRFKPDIKFQYVYYYDSTFNEFLYKANPGLDLHGIARQYAKSYKINLDRFKTPDEIRREIDLYPEKNRLVMQLKLGGQTTFLRTFNDMEFWPSETETAAALTRLTKPLPKIAFLQGQEERSIDRRGDRHYKLATNEIHVRASLVNQGFEVEALHLQDREIPAGLAALVIADPREDFPPAVLDKIIRFINEGGNMLVAGEPGKQPILKPILQELGVQFMDGMILQGNADFSPSEVTSFLTPVGSEFGRKVSRLYRRETPIGTPGVAGLEPADTGRFTIRELLRTDGQLTWNKIGPLVLDSADIRYNLQAGDVKQSISTALVLTRKISGKEQRILVAGDADFLSNAELGRTYPQTGNADLFQGFLGWFTYGKFPIEPTWPEPKDNSMTIAANKVVLMKWFMLGLIPLLGLSVGAILLIRRKRK